MITVLRVELLKIFSRWRTYIGFIAVGMLVPIVVFAMQAEGSAYFSFATQALQDAFSFSGNLMNGYTVTYIILGSLYVHVPLLVTLVAGDMLSGEATAGTYRLIVTRPISRGTIVTSKYLVSVLYANLLLLFLAVLSLGLGISLLGTGELVVVRSQITILDRADVIWRFVAGFGFAALSMTTVASIAFLLSALVENSLGPVMTTMAIIIVFTIISALDVPILNAISPAFFTNHMNGWKLLFDDPVDWPRVLTSTAVLLAHCVASFTAVQVIIRRKDILT
jgi:ABC-2 type transport system permease protein